MIKKIFRLQENEVKKVLKYSKPFFSYNIVLNRGKNTLGYNRFAIIISGKSVKNSVERVFFRRKFYHLIEKNISIPQKGNGGDFVFVVKKKSFFSSKDPHSIGAFEKDIAFLVSQGLKI